MRIIFFDCQCSLSTISLSYIHISVVKVEPKARNALHGGVHVKLSRFQGVHTVLRPLFYSNQIDYEKHRNGLGYVFTRSRFRVKFIGDGAGTQEPYVHYGGSAARTALVTPAAGQPGHRHSTNFRTYEAQDLPLSKYRHSV